MVQLPCPIKLDGKAHLKKKKKLARSASFLRELSGFVYIFNIRGLHQIKRATTNPSALLNPLNQFFLRGVQKQ